MPAKPLAIIMCDYWAPTQSANTVCVEKLLAPLSERYDVILITADEPDSKESQRVIGVGDLPIKRSLKKAEDSSIKTRFIKLMNKFRVLLYTTNYPIRSWSLVARYKQACRTLLDKGGVSLVIAVCFPGECVEAAVRLKREYQEVRFVAYFLDEVAVGMYRKNRYLRSFTASAARRFENKAIATLDGSVYLSSSKDLVLHNHASAMKKIAFVDVPLITKKAVKYNSHVTKRHAVTVLYAGSLANPDRNPSRFIQSMFPLCKSGIVRMQFAGDSAGLLEDFRGQVEDLGVLPSSLCDSYIESADILLSIGNQNPYLVPSKIFKYINLGKPIIHLKRSERDSCMPYLSTYPISLVIDEERDDIEQKGLFGGFCGRDSGIGPAQRAKTTIWN